MNTSKSQEKRIITLSLMILSLCFLMPFLWTKGSLYGDDLHFHIMRMESLSNVLRSPVNFEQFYNGGQAINLFYPYLLYYPYFLIYKVIGHFWIAWIIYLYLLTNMTLFIAYKSAKTISKSSKVGLIFALLYGFSAYRSHNILVRFAVGEFISSAVLPLVFCGLYLIIKTKGKRWLPLTLRMTLLIYSHVMSAIITTVILSILAFLTFAYWEEKGKILLSTLKAALTTVLLTAAFWAPMLEQFVSVKISGVTKLAPSLYSLPLKEVLTVNLRNDILSHHIGLVFLIMIVFLATRYKHFTAFDKLIWWFGIFFWLSTTNLLNWDSLTFLHRGFVQLPWRFNTYALLMISYLTASQIKLVKKDYVLALIPLAIVALHAFSLTSAINRLANAPVALPWTELSYRNDYHQLTNTVFVPDYTNVAPGFSDNINASDPRWKVIQHEIYINENLVESENSYQADTASFKVTNPFEDGASAYLPVYFYKGQVVTVNGKTVPSSVSSWSSTKIELPKGENTITVSYTYTKLARLAQALSLITAISLFSLYYWQNRPQRQSQNSPS